MNALCLRIALSIGVQLAVTTVWPTSTAHASTGPTFSKEAFHVMLVVPQVLIADGGFLVVDAVYGFRGRLLPPGWAITQLIFAGAGSYVASAMLMQFDVGAGIGSAAVGTWFVAHSTASLIQHAREHPPQTASGARKPAGTRGMPPPPPRNNLTLVPIAQGAALIATGVF